MAVQSAIQLLTAICFAMHMVLGCCAHHVHSDAIEIGHHDAQHCDHDIEAGEDDHGGDHGEAPGEHEGDCDDCCGGSCYAVRAYDVVSASAVDRLLATGACEVPAEMEPRTAIGELPQSPSTVDLLSTTCALLL